MNDDFLLRVRRAASAALGESDNDEDLRDFEKHGAEWLAKLAWRAEVDDAELSRLRIVVEAVRLRCPEDLAEAERLAERLTRGGP